MIIKGIKKAIKIIPHVEEAGRAINRTIKKIIKGSTEVLTKRDELLNSVQNQKLKNAVDQIYRPGATTGDGGLADAVKHELATGEQVGGRSHIQKALERIQNLENIIKKENLNQKDLEIATEMLNDLKNALGGN